MDTTRTAAFAATALFLTLVSCDQNIPDNAVTPQYDDPCKTFFIPLGEYSTGELVEFCETTIDYPFYIRHTDLTDKGGINTTAVFCCSEERDSIPSTGSQIRTTARKWATRS
ncbi:MAG: hypothetical protein JSW34_12260 [Candidatus Zixiibacteriota bacterium]|nr:MAG: hypothetical protein JSW34_12260 [candidate division Zixibacteria bacterium]